ncbi:uncharacterized protein LOC133891447 isoform X2 [Phragmites australis]|uniref:uncharacterized protein LOC133891447 isoform X2 n=1 Tax=Phragmites australis TaxID=29695 RepID=UPI002D7724F2|nr:uncharacterized protein LOC133891447 isoform X2 [Phragmites australis]
MGYAPTVKVATAAAAAAVLAAAGVRFMGPAAAAFVADGLPRAQAVAGTWLTPPYLYLVINAIIISIAVSSRFQQSSRPSASGSVAAAAGAEESEHVGIEPTATLQVPAPVVAVPVVAVRAAEAVAVEEPVMKVNTAAPALAGEEEFSISRSTWTPRRWGAELEVEADAENEVAPFADLTNSKEKPLVSSRFSRKAAKQSPEALQGAGLCGWRGRGGRKRWRARGRPSRRGGGRRWRGTSRSPTPGTPAPGAALPAAAAAGRSSPSP